jgi:GNAT superfamily N-acetyltransferase
MNLTLNMYTQWYWKIDLHNLMHFLALRADAHAQYEIRVYADAMSHVLDRWMPITAAACREHIVGGARLPSATGLKLVKRMLSRAKRSASVAEAACAPPREWRERMVASIRNWPILINDKSISPELRGLGYGKALMWHSMAQSRMLGHSRIILVGDPEYYNQFGFRRDLALNIQLPGWVEDRRFLALELVAGSMIGVHGMIGKWRPGWRPKKTRQRG